jgi:CubicO group peptidase (beta-lactamase class C family)
MNKKIKLGCIYPTIIVILSLGIFGAYVYYEIKGTDAKVIKNYTIINEEITKSITEQVKDIRPNSQISIGIYDNGKTEFYGLIRVGDTLKGIENADSIFGIGSISKTFAVSIFSQMVAEKKVQFNEDLANILKIQLANNIKINLKQLANHTSGLPRIAKDDNMGDMYQPYIKYDEKWIKNYLQKDVELEHDQNKDANYSNLGMGLLGYALAIKNNSSYATLFDEQIAKKYNLKNTTADYQKIKNKLAKCYNIEGNIGEVWQFKDPTIAAGGVFSSSRDMIEWAKIQMDTTNKAIQFTHIPTAKVNKIGEIGLGWLIVKVKNKDFLFHNGQIGVDGGYSSTMFINKNEQKAVIILTNIADFTKMGFLDKVGKIIAKQL